MDVQKNLSELDINDKEDQVREMSKFRFQAKVKKAFEDLVKLKNTHNQVKHINFSYFKMQGYLNQHCYPIIRLSFCSIQDAECYL